MASKNGAGGGGGEVSATTKVVLGCGLAVATSANGLLTRLSQSGSSGGTYSYDPAAVVVLGESLKLFISLILLYRGGEGLSSIDPYRLPRYAVPGLVYFVANNLVFQVIRLVPVATAMLLLNLRIPSTVLLFRVMMKKPFSPVQYVACLLLFCGVIVAQQGDAVEAAVAAARAEGCLIGPETRAEESGSGSSSSGSSSDTSLAATTQDADGDGALGNASLALIAASVVSLLSATAAVYTEMLLKGPPPSTPAREKVDDPEAGAGSAAAAAAAAAPAAKPPSLHLSNVQLYAWGVFLGLLRFAVVPANTPSGSMLEGTGQLSVMAVIANAALNGLLTSAVMKYLDNIIKLFCSAAATLLAMIVGVTFFKTPLTIFFFLGFGIIVPSLWLYNIFPHDHKAFT